LRVTLELDRLDDQSSDALAYDLCLLVQEALVNAARHAAASEVRVHVASADGQIHVVVTDNGRGFPFLGDYDHAALISLGLGPVMLKQRINSLGGTLAIRSTPAGARLDILVPRGPES
jgi:two-component system NarL family sensor kinase